MKEFKDGDIILSIPYDIVDENGNPIPSDKSDWDYTPRKEKCKYNKKYCSVKKKKKEIKEEKKEMSIAEQTPVSQEVTQSAETAQSAQKETTPVVSVPSVPDVAQLKNAIPQTGNDTVTVILSAIAVMGGATAWKFYTQKSKLAHEERMKQLENDSNKNDNHEACKATSVTLSARITALEEKFDKFDSKLDEKFEKFDVKFNELDAKVTKVEKSTLSLSSNDLEELEERVEKLEKTTKRKPGTKA